MRDYILARWRDAITDPPPDGWTWIACLKKHGRKIEMNRHCLLWGAQPGDRWLDITAIPAVPREAVQAAVDGIESRRCAIPGQSYDPHRQGVESGLAQGLRELRDHTGVAPTEVTP